MKYLSNKRIQSNATDEGGFTLVELIVTISILVLIIGAILVQGRGSRDGLYATNEAYEAALLIRKAQSFGVSVGESKTGSFDLGFGVYVSTSDLSELTLFGDGDGGPTSRNDFFEGEPDDSVEEVEILGNDVLIDVFCGTSASIETCSDGGSLNNMSIVFQRPDPDAIITGNDGAVSFDSARIDVISLTGVRKRILVFSTGQIAVEENP